MNDFRFGKGIYHKGASWLLQFDILDAAGAAVNVSAYTLRFVGRQPGIAGALKINLTDGAGITVSGVGNNRISVLVPAATTEDVDVALMSCTLWREDSDPNTYPLKNGIIQVTGVAELP